MDENEHVMTYRAGLVGFGPRDTTPGWSCKCGGWSFAARAMPRRETGNNRHEAERSFAAHIAEPPPQHPRVADRGR